MRRPLPSDAHRALEESLEVGRRINSERGVNRPAFQFHLNAWLTISTPAGPSHQAIEDVAIMRALPNLTVIDVADAVEIEQVVPLIADLPGPVYLRLKRGEIPVIFEPGHRLELGTAQCLEDGAEA